MLKLIIFPPAFGLPSASPFCVKAMCLLKMAGAEYETLVSIDPRRSPKGKLPVLKDGAVEIADSEDIRAHLEKTCSVDFDTGLGASERAVSRAFIRLAEEHLYFAGVADRWLTDANWDHMKAAFFSSIPAPIRGFVAGQIRKKVRAQVIAQGIGRHDPVEQLARVEADLVAITTLLGKKPFLFGETPTAADASVLPMLASIQASPTPTGPSRRVAGDPVLMGYIARGKAALYPVS